MKKKYPSVDGQVVFSSYIDLTMEYLSTNVHTYQFRVHPLKYLPFDFILTTSTKNENHELSQKKGVYLNYQHRNKKHL